MRRSLILHAMLLTFALGLWLRAQPAKEAETPIGEKWWPSEWGATDQRGAANRLTAEKVLEAKALIKTGKVYQLGRLYEQGMPIPGKRHFSLTIPGLPTGGSRGKNKLVQNKKLVRGR